MKRSITDKAKGTFHDLKGSVKEKTGRAIDSPRLTTEGRLEKIRGRAQKKIATAEKILGT
jgi:uncharacterized protein YjbJ (UPF0337 family)